jgi:hypothetical protein
MRAIIASDLHGFAPAIERLREHIDAFAPDNIILLGDLLYHGPRNDINSDYNPKRAIPVLNELADKIIAVRGNCDAEVDQAMLDFPMQDTFAQVVDGDVHMFLSHGHIYSPEKHPEISGPRRVFLSGHTHVKTLNWRAGVLCVNPGSTSIPRDGVASFATYEDGLFTLCKLENGHIIEQCEA